MRVAHAGPVGSGSPERALGATYRAGRGIKCVRVSKRGRRGGRGRFYTTAGARAGLPPRAGAPFAT
ncbi:Uncharacterised protein [Burkholderia pseudomallei]|nr:hypothetical protein AQ15_3906 [Burkholderia pseudomallei K96243]OMS33510.1 hypothetical protein AQ739_03780 [Burkholderia pseudomallei]OMT04403.1 hypothetical protein AQ752_23985 [Burkholderia pseudomallei]RFS49361.1 hypothetical protein D0U05_32735 [Burkholderia pseudomallei]RFS64752.1 hypothetical protein D0U02_07825 [Burkholderia pseudomallei]